MTCQKIELLPQLPAVAYLADDTLETDPAPRGAVLLFTAPGPVPEDTVTAFLGEGYQVIALAPDCASPEDALRVGPAAVAALRRQASRFFVDPELLFVCGVAGGACAALAAACADCPPAALSPEECRVTGLLLGNPVLPDALLPLCGKHPAPAFLWQGASGDALPFLALAGALRAAAVRFSLHRLPPEGFRIDSSLSWKAEAALWMRQRRAEKQ